MPPEYSEQALWYATHIEPHEPQVRHWLKSRYGSQCDVDDVVQDALLRIFKAREKAELKSPKAFFFAVARNVAVNGIRKSKVAVTSSILDAEALGILDEGERVDEVAARNHELEILTQAIQALPERCRRVFTLSKVYGMTYNDIARDMGISFNTVSAQIAIGLSKCTRYMGQFGRD
jgi:RNA polymerase sigma-70 factor (ECF subfamily)